MKANDERAQEHIDFLDDHCSNLEAEIELLKLEIAALKSLLLEHGISLSRLTS